MSGYLSMYQLTRAGTRSKQRTPPELDLWLPSYMHIVVVDFAWLVDRDDAPQLLNNCLCNLPEQEKNSLQENKAFYTWDVALPGSFSSTVVRGEVESGSQTSVSCQISVAAHRGARFQVQSFRPYIGPCRVGVEINSGRPVVCSDRGTVSCQIGMSSAPPHTTHAPLRAHAREAAKINSRGFPAR